MVEAFMTYIQAERRFSPLTVRNYRRDINSFLSWCASKSATPSEEIDPTHITAEDIREWIVYRVESCKIGASSVNRELSSLRSFYKYLRRNDFVSQDIFSRISALRTDRKLPTFVPESRMAPLLESIREKSQANEFIEQRNALIIALFYSCGIRLAELQGIRIGDFSADMQTLHVRGKGNKHRVIPILPELAARVANHIEMLKAREVSVSAASPLITSEIGDALSRTTIQRIVKSELSRANVQGKKSPHVLRHTFATHLMNQDADMRNIQELMGHSSLKTTQCYTHNSITKLKEVYQRAHPHK